MMTMAPELLITDPRATANSEPLTVHCIEEDAQARAAAGSSDTKAVWIVSRTDLANRVLRNIDWSIRKAGNLVWIGNSRPQLLLALERRYAGIVCARKADAILPKEELIAVLKSPYRRDRFLGGMVDRDAQIVTLWRGDLTSCVVPFSMFKPAASGTRPDWSRFKVMDYGNTLQFGQYESAADAVLYECDPDFRKRLNKARMATEQTLGASIRRLRKQRRLTRGDFPGLDPKTLARIERGEVAKPQSETRALIAKRLGVLPEELGSF
jgi:hypothetical protein